MLLRRARWTGYTIVLLGLVGLSVAACGFQTPTATGDLTPYVILVTPRPPGATTASGAAGGIFPSLPTPTVHDTTPTPTPPPSPTLVPPTATPDSTTIYVVKPGDSLNAISKKYGVTNAAIIAINDIPDPDNLRIGQQLRIPPPKP